LNRSSVNIALGLKSELLDLSDERWLAFASSRPEVSIFHHPAWTKLLAESYGYQPFIMAVSNSEDRILAGLPMIEMRSSLSGRSWVCLPFTDHCALLSSDYQYSGYLFDCLGRYYSERQLHRLEIRCEPPMPLDPPLRLLYVRHSMSLCPDLDAVASRFHDTHQKNIKVAQRKGLRIERGCSPEHMDAFYGLQLLTRQRKGIPVQPRSFFELLRTGLLENGLGFILLAYKDDECLAAAIFLHWQQTLTYKYSASSLEGRNLCPNNLILWSAIRWGCENGHTLLDMGRTDLANSGLRWFKTGWGAEEVPLYYYAFPSTVRNLGDSGSTRILRRLIRNSPSWVCRLSGELFYRYLG
jgi:hypothetical protein